jgi:DNA repair exonuclease SbcCD nuclease subunit
MNRIRFVHTADIHLDTPFKGLSYINNELAAKLKKSILQAFKNTIDLCIQKKVDFLLIAGDIFESRQRSLSAQLQFLAEINRLNEYNIPVYMVCGNHDPLNSWLHEFKLPPNLHRFSADKPESVTYTKSGIPVAEICGISYKEQITTKNLAAMFPRAQQNIPFSIALLHGTTGIPGPHENYAPFQRSDIDSKGYDYWALGHIHKSQVISSEPYIVYPGNPQGRDFGETGIKGCYLVEMTQGKKTGLQHIPVHTIRFEKHSIDISQITTLDKIPQAIEQTILNDHHNTGDVSSIVRIQLHGRTPLHKTIHKPGIAEEISEQINERYINNHPFLWIDKIDIKTTPPVDIEQLEKGNDFPAEILRKCIAFENDPGLQKQLIQKKKDELSSYAMNKELDDFTQQDREDVFEQAKQLLIDQLFKEA